MLFTVIQRNADGKRESHVVEAESRTALFAILKEHKVVPIQVINGATRLKSDGRRKISPKLIKGVILLLGVAVAVTIGLKCIVTSDEGESNSIRSKHISKIEQHNVSTNSGVHHVPIGTPNPEGLLEVPNVQEQVSDSKSPQPERRPNSSTLGTVYPNNKRQPPRKLFKHFSENYIAGLLRTKPGMAVVGTVLPNNFDDDFKNSLSEEIKIEDEDTADDIEIKEMMKSIKVDARKIIDQGGSIRETILEERKYLQKIAEMRHTLQQEVSKMRKAGASEEELQDTVRAANQMMDEYGGMHVKLSPFRNRSRSDEKSK